MSAFAGFAKGFFEERVKMIDAQQEKQDELVKRLKEIQLKGLEKQQELYDKKAATMAEVEDFYNSGDVKSAYATLASTIAGGSVIENLKKTYGKDYEATYNSEQNRKYIEETIKNWKKTKRPEMSQEELDRIQVRKGVENLAFEQGIRNIFGIDSTEEYYGTPYKGLHDPRPAMSSGVQYREKPKDVTDGSTLVKFEKKDSLGNVYQVAVPVDKMGNPIGPEKRVGMKSEAPVPSGLNQAEESDVHVYAKSTLRTLKDMKDNPEMRKAGEAVEIGLFTESGKDAGALMPVYTDLITKYRKATGTTAVDAAKPALDRLVELQTNGVLEQRKTGGLLSSARESYINPKKYDAWKVQKKEEILNDYENGRISEEYARRLLETL